YRSQSADYTNLNTIKQKFVHEILSHKKPAKVIDLASNKGYYAIMAEGLGASVVAFDYEEEVINFFLETKEFHPKITPVHMDFKKPTAAMGVGLFWHDSFH